MSNATFVLSTGRCGTQWLAAQLQKTYSDMLRVEHEPIHGGYRTRQMLGAKTPLNLEESQSAPILQHIAGIEETVKQQSYLECGHPSWSSIPYLAERFAGQIRVIHLVRHPVPTALSWLTHMAFQPPMMPHLKEKVLLSPFDPGVTFSEYQERWVQMTAYEKTLYYWGELNAFGQQLQRKLEIPWCTISYEDLFHGQGLAQLLSFLDLPIRETLFQSRQETVDNNNMSCPVRPDLRLIAQHPKIVQLASDFGYDALDFDLHKLQRRYSL